MLWSSLRDGNPITRHTLNFEVPLPQFTVTELSFSDKALLRTLVLEMYEQGMSYRDIGRKLGLHWTRVHQIVKAIHQASLKVHFYHR
jgi:hypothetical protein